MRTKMSRRVLSLLLTAAMLCGLLFTTAFAEDGGEHAASEGAVLDALQVEDPNDFEAGPEELEEPENTEEQEAGQEEAVVSGLDAVLTAASSLAEPEEDAGIQPLSSETWAGSGAQSDPYLISDAADLELLSEQVNGGSKYAGTYFKLTDDIEADSWNPIGFSTSYYFAGNFDGDGHTVTIHNITQTYAQWTEHDIGLFGCLGSGAVVHDVTVDGTIAYADSSYAVKAGGIAGYVYGGTIANCTNNAAIAANGSFSSYGGGIAGHTTQNSTGMYSCYNTGTVTGTTDRYLGGLVGYANAGTIQYCFTTEGAAFGSKYAAVTECYDATTWSSVSDPDAWADAANACASAYSSATGFWSLGSDGPEHATCAHIPGGSGVVTAPTCTEKGYTTYTCSICGKQYKGDVTDALGHELSTTVTPAACTEPGSAVEICLRDGCEYESVTEIPALGHTAQAGSEAEYDTYYEYTCENCGETYIVYKDERLQAMAITGVNVSFSENGAYEWEYDSENNRLRSTNYNANSTTSETAITMTSDADFIVSFDYAVSSETNYDKLTITLDSETAANAVSGTVSGSYTSAELPAGAHTLVVKYVKDSSTHSGDDRGYLSNIVIEALCTHENKTQTGRTEATCTEAAYTTYVCSDCQKTIQVYDAGSEPLGHTFGDGDICTVCGAVKSWDGVSTSQPNQQDGVYLIGTGEELAWFAAEVNRSSSNAGLNAKLTADINLGDHDWTPIGKSSACYSGIFDGDDHKITGLYAVDTGTSASNHMGLFGYVYGGTIKNLAVYGTVKAYTSPTISSTGAHAGGIVGYSNGLTMDNCANYAAVYGRYAGGLVGAFTSSMTSAVSITNSYNAGTITGKGQAGGFTGEIYTYSSGGDHIENCFNYGAVSIDGTSNYIGTIWGWARTPYPTVDNFYYLTGSGSYASTYTTGDAKTAEEFKTLAGTLGNAFVDSAELGHPVLAWEAPAEAGHEHTYTYTSSGDGAHTKTCTDPACGDAVVESCILNAEGECILCGWKKPGTMSSPIQISTAAQLQALADEVNGVGEDGKAVAPDSKAGVYYVLTADIVLPGSFTPIGKYNGGTFNENAFSGHFDGQGHTVTLNITDRTGSNARVGLFGSVAGTADSPAVVENVIVNGTVQAYGGSCVAGLVGLARYAEIRNCGNAAVVTNSAGEGYYSSNGAAGILGRSGLSTDRGGSVTISGCFNVGCITADMYAAGIVYDAAQATAIENCYDMGTLTANDNSGCTGGIVAVPTVGMAVSLDNCYAAGTYRATRPGAVTGTISQAMTMSNVYYQGAKWHGGDSDYGWSASHTAPESIGSLDALASSLGGSFKADAEYPLLSWQDSAVSPTAPAEAHTHSYTDTVTAPACTTQGYTTHTCAECGYSYVDTYVPALGHDLGEAVSSGSGDHTHTCSVCGETITESCTYDSGTVTTAPSKDSEGVMTYTCTICGGTKTEVIPASDFLGSGTQADPFLLNDAEDLMTLARNVNAGNSCAGKYFLLTGDVTLNSWTPIGTNTAPFSGAFSGGYYTVDITMDDASHDYNGLFGVVEHATVEKVIITGSITGGSFTAGVAGYAYDSIIRYCGNQAAITGGDNHTFGQNQGPNDCYTGGIVGYATIDTMIVSCYNRGAVTNASTTSTSVPGGAKYTGGIVGNLYSGSVQFCYNTGAITSNTSAGTSYTYTGGIAGMSWSNSVMNSYSAGPISGGSFTGGVVGSTNLYYQQDAFSYYLEGSAPAGAATGNDRVDYINSATADDLKNPASAAGLGLGANFRENPDGGCLVLAWELDPTAEVTYLTRIYTKADLHLFLNSVRAGHDYYGETVVLMNDIDLEGSYTSTGYANAWTAIGDVHGTVFAGTFDGQGFTISNMLLLNDYSGSLGLFSVLPQGAVVKNLTVTGWAVSAGDGSESSCLGGVVGWNQGTVENCHSAVDIDAYNYYAVGGVVGDNAGTVINCTNSGTVNGGYTTSRIGGVVGRCEPAYGYGYSDTIFPFVANCGNSGDVTGYQYVGGVVGAFFNEDRTATALSVTNCYNTGDITGYDKVGGIIGQANLSELTLSNCYNSGIITGIPSSYYLDTCDAGAILGYGSAAVLNSYYQLCDMLPVGHGSGENYARPVSEEYMKTAEFAEMLGGAYQASEGSTPTL